MTRLSGAAPGFIRPATPIASPRLANAIAASLTLAALSVSLIVTLTVLSIRVTMACPALTDRLG